jgi:hypothetical protein
VALELHYFLGCAPPQTIKREEILLFLIPDLSFAKWAFQVVFLDFILTGQFVGGL